MKTFSMALIATAILVVSAGVGQSASDLFQQALVQERTRGDFAEAIALYRAIVERHPDDRELAAKALMAMGRLYERLGDADARVAYQRVISEFADQGTAVSRARARLAVLAQSADEAAGVTTSTKRLLCSGCGQNIYDLSPDARC